MLRQLLATSCIVKSNADLHLLVWGPVCCYRAKALESFSCSLDRSHFPSFTVCEGSKEAQPNVSTLVLLKEACQDLGSQCVQTLIKTLPMFTLAAFPVLRCKFVHCDAIRVLADIFLVIVLCAKVFFSSLPSLMLTSLLPRVFILFYFFSPTCLSSVHHSAPLGQQLILEARSNHCQCLRVRTLCAVVLPTPFHCALQVADCERVTWKILFKKIPSLSFPYGSVFLLRVAKQETFFSATHYDVAECIFPSCAAKCLASPQILSAWICCM